jgi:hypothetical protein
MQGEPCYWTLPPLVPLSTTHDGSAYLDCFADIDDLAYLDPFNKDKYL